MPRFPLKRILVFSWKWVRTGILVIFSGFLLVFLLTLMFPNQILRWTADSWSVAEEPRRGDAIFVLGGGNAFRPQAAAGLWKMGHADLIYVFQDEGPEGKAKSENRSNETVDILKTGGVPQSSIRVVSESVSSTAEEALAIGKIIRSEEYSTVLIPTHLFHTRRVKWIVSRCTDCEIIVTEAPYEHFRAEDWWKNEWGVVQFPNEVLKTVFYWLRY